MVKAKPGTDERLQCNGRLIIILFFGGPKECPAATYLKLNGLKGMFSPLSISHPWMVI